MTTAFAILSAICFVLPFFIWTGISFLEKNRQTVYAWRKKTLWISFGTGILLGIIFLCLAIFLV